ncbi:glycosyltransferase family 4 protein [Anaeromyxobacter paludicola]|uniref:Glycosyltransferase subfamily 4-like N-terminal domain-containing protein n=1 Tax=Anaeromyxobacter paludicola TaxID=2918171 RepID=A0ABM7X8M3_9BACT|nr:glycosyltransferase family 4 protein [Anaeromyxobacter paludicola]BDG08189.1 hypothetical protein AMPC_13020 [Anaeromyxobacter paludicola]
MKIALVGNWPPPHGGIAVHVAGLARALRQRGARVRVLDIGEGDHAGPELVRARGPAAFGAALAQAAVEGWLLHVHTNGANVKSWLVALSAGRARRPFGPRGVLTIHSGHCPPWLAAAADRRLLARAACAGYGKVVAVSEAIAAGLAGAGVPRRVLTVLSPFSPSLAEPGAPPPELAAIRARHAPLYCAALAPGPTYGEDLLVPAFEQVRAGAPRAGLVVFGPGTRAGLAARRGASAGIHALGELEHPAAVATVRGCDVFVRPSRTDGDSVSVREALALGRVVVASDVGHRPPGCLLFPSGDVAALAALLAEAGRSPAPRAGVAPLRDPVDDLWAIYAALQGGPPLPSGGRVGARAPTL